MTQELDFRHPEFTFLLFRIEAMVSQDLKNYSQVFGVFFLGSRVDENIVDENDDKPI